MKIEKLKQLVQLIELLEGDTSLDEEYAIVVLDRGFVYVGILGIFKGAYILNEAFNIRTWGTTNGLGQLVLEGPQLNTKLDACGVVKIPFRSVISIHPTPKELWIKS
jgi:hypothetical protein